MTFEHEFVLGHEHVALMSHLRETLGSLPGFRPESQPRTRACRGRSREQNQRPKHSCFSHVTSGEPAARARRGQGPSVREAAAHPTALWAEVWFLPCQSATFRIPHQSISPFS